MNYLTMISREVRPKSFASASQIGQNGKIGTLQEGIEVILEPTPDLAAATLWVDVELEPMASSMEGKCGRLTDRNRLLRTHELSRSGSVGRLWRRRLHCDASFLLSSVPAGIGAWAEKVLNRWGLAAA